MRHVLAAAVALLACLGVAGCDSRAVPSPFAIEYPAATADGAPMPISLIDQTGLVAGITAAPAGAAAAAVDAVPDRPNVLRVSWSGGACDDRATLVLNRIDAGYELAIHNHPPITAVIQCDAAAAARAVDITFKQVVDPAQLVLNITYP